MHGAQPRHKRNGCIGSHVTIFTTKMTSMNGQGCRKRQMDKKNGKSGKFSAEIALSNLTKVETMKDKKKALLTMKEKTAEDEKKVWIKRKTDWLMDCLAEEILSTYKELGFDEEYIQEKRHILAGKNRLAILLWCNDLDSRCKTALADRLDVDVEDFNITLKTLTKL